MALHRTAPKCNDCGEEIKGKYLDQSKRDPMHVFVGDTFKGWDYVGHNKVCKGTIKDYLKRESKGHTEFRIVVNENGTAYAHVLNRDSETFDFKV